MWVPVVQTIMFALKEDVTQLKCTQPRIINRIIGIIWVIIKRQIVSLIQKFLPQTIYPFFFWERQYSSAK